MNRVDWQDIEGVLAEAMDLPAVERSARIIQLCGDRLELKAEVESLLTAHEKAASFLEGSTQVDSSAVPAFLSRASSSAPIVCWPSWA